MINNQKLVTVLLLNYKRPENLVEIIKALKSQTIPCDIFLWNNSDKTFENHNLDLIINSSENLKCWPRWSMASFAQTPYIMTHDDDLCFTSNDCLERLIETHKKHEHPGLGIGFNGVKLSKTGNYYPTKNQKKIRSLGIMVGPKHVKFPKKDTKVDIVKGRLIFCKKSDLINVPLFVQNDGDRFDDIVISSYLAKKQLGRHLVTSCLNKKIKELPGGDGGMALSSDENWENQRTSISKIYFPEKQHNTR
ncbi:MAG: hypothetical protein ACFHWX_04585 [Bacteroidota bacterium]